MSNMKNGFSTLNRWLGKKNKDKNAPNGKLSKSSTNLSNLSVSTININETSQLEYNRITPLPAATSNAPFEQTFRITVLLPKDQLYVARLGARIKLSKLLELVCDNKLLDLEKYEFRNPVDNSKVYSCDLTIGAVGLSEIRLCHKSESYDICNADDVIKLHRTAAVRDSLSSSSEFSSRNSKHTTKTPSPYSSSNSLNSMDSTGMNYTRTPVTPPAALPTTPAPKMMAPPRKKRAAPRPPIQTSMTTDKSVLVVSDIKSNITTSDSTKTQQRKDYFASTPNLTATTTFSTTTTETNNIDCNGNNKVNEANTDNTKNISQLITNDVDVDSQLELQKNERNLYSGSELNLTSLDAEKSSENLPEPSPRKRVIQIKKKAAPAPPPRGNGYKNDTTSLSSATATETDEETVSTILQSSPKPAVREILQTPEETSTTTAITTTTPTIVANSIADAAASPEKSTTPPTSAPKPVPRSTTTLLNATSEPSTATTEIMRTTNNNVSKVMLNRTPTPEPRLLTSEINDKIEPVLNIDNTASSSEYADCDLSKQSDLGRDEPFAVPLPSPNLAQECKSTIESSSDDDDLIKVYNFKLGETKIEQKILTTTAIAELTKLKETPEQIDSSDCEEKDMCSSSSKAGEYEDLETPEKTGNGSITSHTSWNFAIPISPPPNFADETSVNTETQQQTALSDTPIENSKAQVPSVLNIDTTTSVKKSNNGITTTAASPSPGTPINDYLDELTTIISEKRIETLIKKKDQHESTAIEAAKPNTLSNFSITTIGAQQQPITETNNNNVGIKLNEAENIEIINSITTNKHNTNNHTYGENNNNAVPLEQHKSLTRADSLNMDIKTETSTQKNGGGLQSRSSSYLSLARNEQNGLNTPYQRRSSSELSIAESPSLQTLAVIKTILDSRKNSLANSSGSDEEVLISTARKIPTTIVNAQSIIVKAPKTPEEQQHIQSEDVFKPKNQQVSSEKQQQQQLMQQNLVIQQQQSSMEVDESDSQTMSKETSAVTSLESITIKSTSGKVIDDTAQNTTKVVADAAQTVTPEIPQEIPKTYRYSGPPNINFSTWNERPKANVVIKNEGDYIFGGKSANKQHQITVNGFAQQQSLVENRQRVSLAVCSNEKSTIDLASPILRMGIPRREFKVPITVKPLKDVTVEQTFDKKQQADVNLENIAADTKQQRQQETEAAITTTPTIGTITTNTSPAPPSPATSTYQPQFIRQKINIEKNNETGTLRRQFNTTTQSTANVTNRYTMPALLRTTSITQLDGKKLAKVEQPNEVPFGQNTLRCTGLKAKILAKDEREQQQVEAKNIELKQNVDNGARLTAVATTPQPLSPAAVTPTTPTTISPMKTSNQSPTFITKKPMLPIKNSIKCAKIELKLQQPSMTTPTTPLAVSSPSPPPFKVNMTVIQTPKPPTPPVAPALPKLKKSFSTTTTSPAPLDTRDQLLAAIRNFKRDELGRK